MTLTEFVAARLDDKELAARNAGAERWDFTGVNCEVRVREPDGDLGRIIAYCRHGNPVQDDLALAIHIAEHDPARALREVAAGRALIRYLTNADGAEPRALVVGETEQLIAAGRGIALPAEWLLRQLATAWSDHPDYDRAWA